MTEQEKQEIIQSIDLDSILEKTNCPNCGAPITGAKCEYCGTVFKEETVETQILYEDCKPVMTIEIR